MSDYIIILFASSLIFSILLYMGKSIPWFLSAFGGVMSTLFLVVTGFMWFVESDLPEAGFFFFVWAFANLIISSVIIWIGLVPKEQKTRFD